MKDNNKQLRKDLLNDAKHQVLVKDKISKTGYDKSAHNYYNKVKRACHENVSAIKELHKEDIRHNKLEKQHQQLLAKNKELKRELRNG